MNGRRWIALLLVISLTGSALALQQQKVYTFEDKGPNFEPSAEGHAVIQQHTVFTEFIVEEKEGVRNNITEFGAVVGLVKKCKSTRNTFDNAVLWFNDQFLFGEKESPTPGNDTIPDSMGQDPVRVHDNSTLQNKNRQNGTGKYDPNSGSVENEVQGTGPDEGGNPVRDGFIRAGGDQPFAERWGGCFIPNGYVHAVPQGQMGAAQNALDSDANICDGSDCAFEYEGIHYITDPNNHRWMIDRYTWAGGPMYTVHLQVDPWNPYRQGFPDEAIWSYDEDGRIRLGMPYNEDADNPCHDDALVDGDERYTDTAFDRQADQYEYDDMQREGGNDPSGYAEFRRGPVGTMVECSIEYNFLVAVDFDSFSSSSLTTDGRTHSNSQTENTEAYTGNSHPHNPTSCPANSRCDFDNGTANNTGAGPAHTHDTVNLDIFFDRRAPWFTEEHPYWDQPEGQTTVGEPPIVEDDCKDTRNPNDPRRPGVQIREPLVCDVKAMSGFHLHDGSQP